MKKIEAVIRHFKLEEVKEALTEVGVQALVLEILRRHSDVDRIMSELNLRLAAQLPSEHVTVAVSHAMQVLEVMANNDWVSCSVKKNRPVLEISTPEEGEIIHHIRA